MTTAPTFPTVRATILSAVQPRQVAHCADIALDGTFGIDFVKGLYSDWVERHDYTESWEIFTDYQDRFDFDAYASLRAELACSAIQGLVWQGNIAYTWTDFRGWELDDDVQELTDSAKPLGSIQHMAIALELIATRFLDQLNEMAIEAATIKDIRA